MELTIEFWQEIYVSLQRFFPDSVQFPALQASMYTASAATYGFESEQPRLSKQPLYAVEQSQSFV